MKKNKWYFGFLIQELALLLNYFTEHLCEMNKKMTVY